MFRPNQLSELTEEYLKRILLEVSGLLDIGFDVSSPFGELGIHSFQVLKILKSLEREFGTLSKSLLFEYFTVQDLAQYFVVNHEEVLRRKFAQKLSVMPNNSGLTTPTENGYRVTTPSAAQNGGGNPAAPGSPLPLALHILEKDALLEPDLGPLLMALREEYDLEGGVSRGTRKIAPWLFVASSRRCFLNYGRSGKLLLVYSCTGPDEETPDILEEMCLYCESKGLELNCLADRVVETRSHRNFSATPFGALQRISPLSSFSLQGRNLRKLRNAVAKFERSGTCRTGEYRCGSDKALDGEIISVIDRWAAGKTVVNPLVHEARQDILAGTLAARHRLFLTWLDGVLQNAILITAMCKSANGYLMDLEFYPPEMPRGGLEYSIVQIIGVLVAERCELLSLGGTYGCRLEETATADPSISAILDELRERNVFNGEGNLQFKNKFAPQNTTIFLCRPEGSGSPETVLDVILMIAQPGDPSVDCVESHIPVQPTSFVAQQEKSNVALGTSTQLVVRDVLPQEASDQGTMRRMRLLRKVDWNPLRLGHANVDVDLKTDSWAQLDTPFISAYVRQLRTQLQGQIDVEGALGDVFPFPHILLVESGQASEALLFRAWPRRGTVLANLLFPSTLFHLIDQGFSLEEVPHPEFPRTASTEIFRSNIDVDWLAKRLEQGVGDIAFVLVELGSNATGGLPVSLDNLVALRTMLEKHAIPLVLEVTRILENAVAQLEQKSEKEQTLWTIIRDMLSHADAVLGSLTKDFCVTRGGIVAVRDPALLTNLQRLTAGEGSGIDIFDRKLIGLSMRNRQGLEDRVRRRMEAVRLLWCQLTQAGVRLLAPCGGHCVVVDLSGDTPWSGMEQPAASFAAWLFARTGIRCAEHSVGLDRNPLLVRLAVPVGMSKASVETVSRLIVDVMAHPKTLMNLTRDSGTAQLPGAASAKYLWREAEEEMFMEEELDGSTGPLDDKLRQNAKAVQSAASSSPIPEDRDPGEALGTSSGSGIDTGAFTMAPMREGTTRTVEVCSKPADGLSSNEQNGQATKGHADSADDVRERLGPDVAIIGVAGRYPKADSHRELWRNLAQGRDCIEELPAERYGRRQMHGAALRYRGGFLDEIDRFDSLFFNISPREAEMLDPQERLFLEVAWEAVEDAGYYPETLTKADGPRDVGVFVGAVWTMYQMLGVEEKHAGSAIVPNSFLWSIANRVSYWMNFSGPSLTVDTACSSSLTALYLAYEAILRGECSTALVGGVNLDLHQAKLDINQAGGALSSDGVCRSFGKNANGYVAGEGIGALLLKPLASAVRDGDHVYGVIKGVAINHGGRTSGYTVPNPKAQTKVVTKALQRASFSAGSISYVEAHGTGTELGDPIEIAALTEAYASASSSRCAVGSVKSNIGHLEAAAGIVSVSKVLLQMQHRQIAPSLHSAELNSWIDFDHSPFFVPQTLQPWNPVVEDGERLSLRAGVSSFGAGGSNAHVLLESYETEAKDKPRAAEELIFPLSARTEQQLIEMASRLVCFLRMTQVMEHDLAFTLQSGRKAFEHRVAFVATGQDQLCDAIDRYLAGSNGEDICAGNEKNADAVHRLLNRSERGELLRVVAQTNDLRRAARLWADGLLQSWPSAELSRSGKRIPLPTYPFAKKRHWPTTSQTSGLSRGIPGLHPLIDVNESTFNRQIFKKTFHDQDFFIYDHLVGGIPTLPGVAYLEFARKAGELAAGKKVHKIKNVLWLTPITVEKGATRDVWIELKPERAQVRFEVFSFKEAGKPVPHSQGVLLYSAADSVPAEEQRLDLTAIRARSKKVTDGHAAYPKFAEAGLHLGQSFQVLKDVLKNGTETLGQLDLPEARAPELLLLELHPSLIDGSLQAGVSAQLGESAEEMYVPFSLGEVEILHPLTPRCYSYVTRSSGGEAGQGKTRIVKSDVLIVDETGKVLVKIRESTGVPLRELQRQMKPAVIEDTPTLFYGYDWEPFPEPSEEPIVLGAGTVLFVPAEWCGALREVAPEINTVVAAETFATTEPGSYTLDPQRREDFERLLLELTRQSQPLRCVCFLWPLTTAEVRSAQQLDEALQTGLYAFLFLCQAILERKLESSVQLLYVHASGQFPSQPQHEAIRGFIHALRLEHPKFSCRSVAVQTEASNISEILRSLARELAPREQEAAAIRYEGRSRSVRRLQFLESSELTRTGSDRFLPRGQGVYLITGGAGGLGLLFADFLAHTYQARLLLLGRSALNAEQDGALEELRKHGAEIEYRRGDVANPDDVRDVVQYALARWGALHGVVHAAGVLRDALVRTLSAEDMRAVLSPKVQGTRNLDDATRDLEMDFFVLFSSLAAVNGNVGQSNYSYANHFMDAFAEQRNQLCAAGDRKGHALSLNWSVWNDGGMKLDEQTAVYFRQTIGIVPIRTENGVAAFLAGLQSGRSQLAVVEGDRKKIDAAWGPRKKPATLTKAAVAPAKNHIRHLEGDLAQTVAEFLKLEVADVDPEKVLLDLGFDSIGLTTFANAINERYALDITPVLFFDYPSVREIAKHLVSERRAEIDKAYGNAASEVAAPALIVGMNRSPQETAQPEVQFGKKWDPFAESLERREGGGAESLGIENRSHHMPIAIVGMSGVMPQSNDLAEFWANLRDAKNMISVVPQDRWNWEEFYGDPLTGTNKTDSKWGGFMREVDKFDSLFFSISPREAQVMDPQQRIFLEQVWKAVEDSGHKVSELSGTRTGVFVGVATNDYADLMHSVGTTLDGYTASGNSHSVLANRVSFLLNLHGPSAPIDTACSSSLIALHRAVESIHSGNCEMAIVGGVQVMMTPAAYISFSMAGMLSKDGRCKTFDKSADGYVRGEGAGAVFLKTLAAAQADGDHIYAVIRSTAENHGGRVTTLTAPNSTAQAALLVEAYDKGGIDPATVGYIECHGTGTSLGDPIEIQALGKAFTELYKRHGHAQPTVPHCGLSAVKTNIGHLETAAGIAGILKVLLAIKHQQIPAVLHFEELNPFIQLKGTPFYIVDKLTPWGVAMGADGAPQPRRAGISSFGFGGANAHIVLEEYPQPERTPRVAVAPQLIVISAKTEERLKDYVRALSEHVAEHQPELDDVAYTLQVGRDEMPERLAFVAVDTADLEGKLRQILEALDDPSGISRGQVRPGNAGLLDKLAPEVLACTATRNLRGLASLWVQGGVIEWIALYEHRPRRLSLPTYPFARERHWISIEDRAPANHRSAVRDVGEMSLHPLVQRNISTLAEQKFASRFTGEEFFFSDHRVAGRRILPGVAYLEMAHAAGAIASGERVHALRDVLWERPLVVQENVEDVEIALIPDEDEVLFIVRSAGEINTSVFCSGRITPAVNGVPPVRDLVGIRKRCPQRLLSKVELYPFLREAGLELGDSFKVVEEIYANPGESLATLSLPEHLSADADRFYLHPALMDGSLHTAMGLMRANGLEIPLSIPYSLGRVEIFGSLKDLRYGYATWDTSSSQDSLSSAQDSLRIGFDLLDGVGNVLVRIEDLVSRPVSRVSEPPPARSEPMEVSGFGLRSCISIWREADGVDGEAVVGDMVLLGGGAAELLWLRASYPGARQVTLNRELSVAELSKRLRTELRGSRRLVWMAAEREIPATVEGMVERQGDGVVQVFRLVKALLELGYGNRGLDWTLITRQALEVISGEAVDPTDGGLVGFVGSLAKEYSGWTLRLLDVPLLAAPSAAMCWAQPADRQGDPRAFRGGKWYTQRLVEAGVLSPGPKPPYRHGGVYVVVGGAGGIGEVWTRHVMEHYGAEVVWVGRRSYTDEIEARVRRSTVGGRAPLYLSADATDAASLDGVRAAVLARYGRVTGVVHSALVLADSSIARMEESGLRVGLATKLDVSVNLASVFDRDDLDLVLFFSSVVSFFKTPGQSNYAAGCTFQDSFASWLRHHQRGAVKTIHWGYWGEVGAVASPLHRERMAQVGIGSLEPERAMAALDTLVGCSQPHLIQIKTVPSLTKNAAHGIATQLPLLQQQSPATADMAIEGGTGPSIHTPILSLNGRDRVAGGNATLEKIILRQLADALRIDQSVIRTNVPFADYGVDSIAGISFIRALNAALILELNPAVLFEYTTVSDLTAHLETQYKAAHSIRALASSPQTAENDHRFKPTFSALPQNPPAIQRNASAGVQNRLTKPAAGSAVPKVNRGNTETSPAPLEPIAIIGMSGRFAESPDLETFWDHLRAGDDLVTEVSRWRPEACTLSTAEERPYCKRGSFLEQADQFDAGFFRITPLEATYMDPQQRLLLETSWHALEDAGYAGEGVHATKCGVYVGCGTSNYEQLFGDDAPAQAWWGNSSAVAPARIAYHLHLHGPAITVDTACSSSLVAMHMACQGLWLRETEMALAGGVYVEATPGFHQVANRAGMLSAQGSCRSFDAGADGFVPGEGVGVVVLKRLSDAARDGDFIHGTIVAMGVSQNGRSNGQVAPNGQAQERLVKSVYERFAIQPDSIQMLEAHGTGTLIGDSIEFNAMRHVFEGQTDRQQFCALGSVKSNVGHGATAAGITSVLKVLLALRYKELPPSPYFEQANPSIDLATGPFVVNTAVQPWDREQRQRRRAAVSSFGFSGTNAHAVLEEAPAREALVQQTLGSLIVLSARSWEQLRAHTENLLNHLIRNPDLPLNDVAYSLFCGRTHLNHRLATIVHSIDTLIQVLKDYLLNSNQQEVFTAVIARGATAERVALRRFGNHCIQECRSAQDSERFVEHLQTVADLFVQNYALDYRSLFPQASRRVPLPGYPFARERYWVGVSQTSPSKPSVGCAPTLPTDLPMRSSLPVIASANPEQTEKQLLEIWAQVLEVQTDSMGFHDSFFQFGGDSLLATQMLSRVRATFGVDVSLMSLFQNATVAEFSKLLAEANASVIPPILAVKRPENGTFPLGFAQERIWFFSELEPGNSQHNMPMAVTVQGELRLGDLRRAFAVIIDRHESLRTIFPVNEGEGRQQVLPKVDFHLEQFDLSAIPEGANRDVKAKEICQTEAGKPFDLRVGPLLRGLVIHLSSREHILLVNMHHIISDGWSMGVLIRELTTLMDGFLVGRSPGLSSLPLQYIDFCQWQRTWLTQSGLLDQQLEYWQQKLAGYPHALNFATDYPRPSMPTWAGGTIFFDFDDVLLGRIKFLAEAHKATLFMVLVATWKVLLYRYSGQGDVCVATLIAGRQYGETEGMIGMFVNTLALRDHVDGETTFAALLANVKRTSLEAYRHQDVPYDKVVERLRRASNGASNPASQVMLILQNADASDAGRRFPRYSFEINSSEFDLSLDFTELAGGLRMVVEYSTELYRQETVSRFAKDFTDLIEEVTKAPGRVIGVLGRETRSDTALAVGSDLTEVEDWVVESLEMPEVLPPWGDGRSISYLTPLQFAPVITSTEASLLRDVVLGKHVLNDDYEQVTL